MSRSLLVLIIAALGCGPAGSADLGVEAQPHAGAGLPPERHVIEVVRPPYSGSFIINGKAFIAKTPACWSWSAGERVTLLAGEWHAVCESAVFYNLARHQSCEMWCGWLGLY
jgi:hypothetical protein